MLLTFHHLKKYLRKVNVNKKLKCNTKREKKTKIKKRKLEDNSYLKCFLFS